jgi:hypothetical protein
MDSTLPHFKDSEELLLDLYWTRSIFRPCRNTDSGETDAKQEGRRKISDGLSRMTIEFCLRCDCLQLAAVAVSLNCLDYSTPAGYLGLGEKLPLVIVNVPW